MREIKIGLILSAILFGIASCTSNPKEESATFEVPATILESVTAIPDSVATAEQLALKQTLQDIFFSKVIVENNQMILTVDRSYFVENKIPPSYYDIFQASLKESNDAVPLFSKQGNMEYDMAKIYEESKKAYWERRK